MSDYSSVAPPQQNFNQSAAFAAALQRAKQVAAKINPGATETRQKRPLEETDGPFPEPEAKKCTSLAPQVAPTVTAITTNPIPVPTSVTNVTRPSGIPMGGPSAAMCAGLQVSEDIKVPDKMVGLIIGRGGEQISRLQLESGCKIQMAPDSNGMPDRICSLSGTKEAINNAKELIMNIVHQRGRNEGLGGGGVGGFDSGGGGGGGQSFPGAPSVGGGGSSGIPGASRNFVEIMLPGPKVGLVIGKGGETIKQLQEKSGAKMVVIQDGPNPEQEKPLRISGDPSKVEYAKQLVYDLLAEKEMQGFNRRPGGAGIPNPNGVGGMAMGGGGATEAEVLVPRQAVGVVIGKGGDMIKKLQAETGARVQFQQMRDEGPGDRRCLLTGAPKQVETARQRIEELIDSVFNRDDSMRGQGRSMGRNGMPRNGQDGSYGMWGDDRRSGGGPPQAQQEVTFTVPSSKCGIIIGRGGDTIKQINQQSGAHCELDRRNSQNTPNAPEKVFVIRGEPEHVEAAKRIISDKVQMPLNFVIQSGGAPGMMNSMPTSYPGMGAQSYNASGWPGYQQQWGATPGAGAPDSGMGGAPSAMGQQPNASVQINPTTGQPDYSLQWAEYYRNLGMHREAEMIEQQAKSKGVVTPMAQTPMPAQQQQPIATPTMVNTTTAVSNGSGQQDYSAQWADYYRGIGKHKEAEAIEAQMKAKNAASGQGTTAAPTAAVPMSTPTVYPQQTQAPQTQQPYPGYQVNSYYGAQPQPTAPSAVPPSGYSFPSYGYGAPAPPAPTNAEN